MENSIDLSYIFETELIKEIESSGEIKRFHEGDLIMDYGSTSDDAPDPQRHHQSAADG